MPKNFNQFTNKTTPFVANDRIVGFSSTAENGEFKTTYTNLLNSIESSLNLDDSSFNTNGYQKIGALIIQWGLRNGTLDDTNGTVNFPIEFPNNCLNVQVTLKDSNNAPSSASASASVQILNKSSFKIYGAGISLNPDGYYWLAIGH